MTGHWQSSTKAPAGVWVRIPSEKPLQLASNANGVAQELLLVGIKSSSIFVSSNHLPSNLSCYLSIRFYFLFLNDLSQVGSREACGEQRTPISGTASCSGWRRGGILFPFHEGVPFPPLFLPIYTWLSIWTAFFLISMVPFCTPLLSKDKRFSMYPA